MVTQITYTLAALFERNGLTFDHSLQHFKQFSTAEFNLNYIIKVRREIKNKFQILENLDDEDSIDNNINEKWEDIKTIIKKSKQQLIEKDEGTETFKNK